MSCIAPVVQASDLTLGELVRNILPVYSQTHRLPPHIWSALRAIGRCRTPSLGGHIYQCAECGAGHFVPHSCRNRHCPTCQGVNGADWMDRQMVNLLPIPYFHVVFTLPHDLNPIIQYNQARLYALLFDCASRTLLEFGQNNLKATIGVTAVLHTWSQTLLDHYHLHCIVTGGGLNTDGSAWIPANPNWLFAVRALSAVFRAKFRDGLKGLFESGNLLLPPTHQKMADPSAFAAWLRQICRHRWVVYAKRPFPGPTAVLAYLCRYTHRVGITNRRLERFDRKAQIVTFRYNDYADGSQTKSMTLDQNEFLRRFCLHILPPRFVKIRHYGLLANRDRDTRIVKARELIGSIPESHPSIILEPLKPRPERPNLLCPHCNQPTLILVRVIKPLSTRLPSRIDTS